MNRVFSSVIHIAERDVEDVILLAVAFNLPLGKPKWHSELRLNYDSSALIHEAPQWALLIQLYARQSVQEVPCFRELRRNYHRPRFIDVAPLLANLHCGRPSEKSKALMY